MKRENRIGFTLGFYPKALFPIVLNDDRPDPT